MTSQSTTTTDHDGKPASVRSTESGDDPGMLRIDFPGRAGEDDLEHISWDQWFEKFAENNSAFLYQEQKSDGSDSTFFKLVSR